MTMIAASTISVALLVSDEGLTRNFDSGCRLFSVASELVSTRVQVAFFVGFKRMCTVDRRPTNDEETSLGVTRRSQQRCLVRQFVYIDVRWSSANYGLTINKLGCQMGCLPTCRGSCRNSILPGRLISDGVNMQICRFWALFHVKR